MVGDGVAFLALKCAGVRDLPQRRLLSVAGPLPGSALADRVPARLMLPVIVTAAEHEVLLGPNDLRTDDERRRSQARLDDPGVETAMPDIGDVAREQGPGLTPIRAIVVFDLSQ
jgi:hypothetical protein